jgi:hypothetical protein
MATRVAATLALLAVSSLCGCSSHSEHVAPGPHGIECACCFTIVEYVRSTDRPAAGATVRVQCEQCCGTLTFTAAATGQLFVDTGSGEVPCDLCVPAPPR